MKNHYTAIVSFTTTPENLKEIISQVNNCIQEVAEHGTEITIVAQEKEEETSSSPQSA